MGIFDFLGKAQTDAADARQDGLRQGLGVLQGNQTRLEGLFNPAIAGGEDATATMRALLGLEGGQAAGDAFGQFRQSPGFQHALDTSNRGIERSAFARGQGLSGASVEALQANGIGLANQDFGNHFNRLSGLSNQGANARNSFGSFLTNNANNQANIFGQIGQAKAGGITDKANAHANLFNTGAGIASRFAGNFF